MKTNYWLLTLCLTAAACSTTLASDKHEEKHHEAGQQHEKHLEDDQHEGDHDSHGIEEHPESRHIDDKQLQQAGVKTAVAGPRVLIINDQLFGVIAAAQDRIYTLYAPYPSMVEKVHVQVGDQVNAGQTLATLRNIATLQSYALKAPSNGEVTDRLVNAGSRVEQSAMLVVTDLSRVWVEMSAFPESIEKLALGQTVTVADMHRHETAKAQLTYISPTMTGGHIARGRAEIDNPTGHWRPGMHVTTEVQLSRLEVDLAVESAAIQNMHGGPVIFIKSGNSFQASPIKTGDKDQHYTQILEGITAGTEYVSQNSFLIKADLLKGGASHDH